MSKKASKKSTKKVVARPKVTKKVAKKAAKKVSKKAGPAKVKAKKSATKKAVSVVKKTTKKIVAAVKAKTKSAKKPNVKSNKVSVQVTAPLLPAGTSAPSFTLLNQDGQEVRLEDFRGQKTVVLYFYPKAMTPGCTVQACGIRDNNEKFQQKDVVVLAVSPDSPESLKKFEQKEQLNFNLLSDKDHKVAESYGVWGPKKFMGREYQGIHRTTFVIGKDGNVKKVLADVNTKTHHEDTLRLVDEETQSSNQ